MGKTCHYCGADISHLHWNSKHCKSDQCQDKYDADRLKRVEEANKRYRKKRVAVAHYKNPRNVKLGSYRCRYCNKRLPKDGNRLFCNDWCQDQYAGADRLDGDWMFA